MYGMHTDKRICFVAKLWREVHKCTWGSSYNVSRHEYFIVKGVYDFPYSPHPTGAAIYEGLARNGA